MAWLLVAMLAIDAILHGTIILRFGVRGNEPPLIFGIAYAVLAVAVFLTVPYALWAVLIISLVGTAGLAATFKSIPHDTSVERAILVLNATTILYVAYLLFVH